MTFLTQKQESDQHHEARKLFLISSKKVMTECDFNPTKIRPAPDMLGCRTNGRLWAQNDIET